MEQQKQKIALPDNAYRELKEGEEYKPLMPASETPAEVTPYSVAMGIVMAIIFSSDFYPFFYCNHSLLVKL